VTRIFELLRGFSLAASMTVAALVFIADLRSPRGLTVTSLYVVPILLTLVSDRPRLTLGVAGACTLLVLVGYHFSPDAGVPTWIALADCLIVILLIWVTSWLGVEITRAKRRIRELEKWLTLCAWTKQVNVDGQWIPIERYLADYCGLKLTHGMSQEALNRFMGEVGREIR
jgi:ABC-type multidrug transport system fused ATPase/permease subunit